MARKVSVKQEPIPGFDLRERERITHSHEVDVRPMRVGAVIGDGRRVIRCPRRGMGSLFEPKDKIVRFVHRGLLGSTSRTVHWRPVAFCSIPKEEFQALIKSNVVVVNRFGQILDVVVPSAGGKCTPTAT